MFFLPKVTKTSKVWICFQLKELWGQRVRIRPTNSLILHVIIYSKCSYIYFLRKWDSKGSTFRRGLKTVIIDEAGASKSPFLVKEDTDN